MPRLMKNPTLVLTFIAVCYSVLNVEAWRSGGSGYSKGASIAREADRYIGSTEWARSNSRGRLGPGQWKCSLFVAEVVENAGAKVPHRRWWYSPIGAGEWANSSSSYLRRDRCWTRVTSPRIGDVAGYEPPGKPPHVGIVSGTSLTTSAAEDSVVKNDWGFRSHQTPTFWRYTC